MDEASLVEPLPLRHRQRTFWALLVLFVCAIPFIYLYATGYRFEFGERANIVSTGGMYIAAERTGAEIYIDNELVRETRVFRRAFYAQSLEPGTHRVHVQKDDHHTWVKELPVLPHLVTEAQAFNLPLAPQVRVISKWQSATGSAVVYGPLLNASTTNAILRATTTATSTFTRNVEYTSLMELFATTTATTSKETPASGIFGTAPATTTATTSSGRAPTTTKESRGVRLFEDDGSVFVAWVGSRESMPYYYCAEEFPPYSTSTSLAPLVTGEGEELTANTAELLHPVQSVSEGEECDPVIELDRMEQSVRDFDFLPGSTDFIILALEDGAYVVEADDRAWQNIQPLLLGEELRVRVENGQVYVYDGELIYHVILEY